ncbi:hypothetical protein SARC_00968 [Sphaeroforma arctica JP610]|uniref:Uncharacterized protein n=1 Tax=Sphaeroforma arctica JP610 TaxID=667725 RepID=A0A0L0GEZ1_9EUKA|nr:hypothetical protein SARC_00968 [Sphaeroforma arctica JP610]KNC86873.1 hypothetical protein SARC_00968 [Sphaeroforma arctica JP610]|eukprot:XP_014160775.1 hypothetical protein SARC_00968 [Sphaeroforma arctica JP610]
MIYDKKRRDFAYVRCAVYDVLSSGAYKKTATTYIQFKGAKVTRQIEVPIDSTCPITCIYNKDHLGTERLSQRKLEDFTSHPESFSSAEEFYRLWREHRGHENRKGLAVLDTVPLRLAKITGSVSNARNLRARSSDKKEWKLSDSISITSLRHAASKLSLGSISIRNLHGSKSESNVLDGQVSPRTMVSPHSNDDESVGPEALKLSPGSSRSDLSSSESGRDSGYSSSSQSFVSDSHTSSGPRHGQNDMGMNFLNPMLWVYHQPVSEEYNYGSIQSLIYGKSHQSKQHTFLAKPALRHYSTAPDLLNNPSSTATVLHPTFSHKPSLKTIPSFEIEDTDMYENLSAFQDMLTMQELHKIQTA